MPTDPSLPNLDPSRRASAGVSRSCAGRLRVSLALLHGIALTVICSRASADDAFTPPRAYPAARYEAGWNKNPFTLKTAPVAVQQRSFAENLVIASYYGPKDNPTVVIADKTTRTRTSLRLNQPGDNGMELKAISIQPARKDTVATIAMAGQTAAVHFDNSFITQMVAQGGGKAQPAPGQEGKVPMSGQTEPNIMTNAAAQSRQVQELAKTTRSGPGASTPPFQATPQTGTSAAALDNAGNVPTPVRRRLLTAPVAPPPAPALQP